MTRCRYISGVGQPSSHRQTDATLRRRRSDQVHGVPARRAPGGTVVIRTHNKRLSGYEQALRDLELPVDVRRR